ncbi:MAG: hypothetical protein CO187_09200 [Zetaproteobacteria bacterium CG_4_9_14_3_um_filter_53_7]|nr:MAG: hypothetical protein CO187_09200 [Zetaproteobacteria bacterium CG_4_9_14_3_um_filter_53_7]
MSDPINWHASLTEHRTAWILSCSCLLLIALAVAKPDLFDPSSYSTPPAPQQAQAEKEAGTPPPPPVEEEVETEAVTKVADIVETAKPAVIDAGAKTETPAPVAKAAPTVVTPAKPGPVSAPAAGYYVQLGAFSEKSRAQGLVDQLASSGWHAVVYQKSATLFAVWAGPESDRKAVDTLQKAIEGKMKIKGFIVHHTGS